MAITSEIIGKLGGAEVDSFPVSGTASGAGGSAEILATIEVPAGETWLVAAAGQLAASVQEGPTSPVLRLGDQASNGRLGSGSFSIAALGTGTVRFQIERKRSAGEDSFTGHVYTVKL